MSNESVLRRFHAWLAIGVSLCFVAITCLATLSAAPAFADEVQWGHLRGQFIFAGPVPEPMTLPVKQDRQIFGPSVPDESLLVNASNKGIANVVVWLVPKRGENLAVHDSYQRTANSKISLTMQDGLFSPHVLLIRTTQTLVQRNKGKVVHQASIQFVNNPLSGRLVSSSDPVELHYTEEEPLPCLVTCNVHSWMRGYVLLRANPYMATTDADGRFVIENLPLGQHIFRVWHERIGWVRNVRLGSRVTDAKGRLAVTINAGENNVAAGRLAAEIFE